MSSYRFLLSIFSVFLIVGCSVATEQQMEVTAEEKTQLEQLKKMLYGTGQTMFEDKRTDIDLGEVKSDQALPYVTSPDALSPEDVLDRLSSQIKTRVQNSMINNQNGLKVDHGFRSNDEVSVERLMVKVLDLDAKDANGKAVTLSGSSNNDVFVFSDADAVVPPITGTAKVKASYHNEFNVLLINQSDIGKTVELDGHSLQALDIRKNLAFILLPPGVKANQFNVSNQTADGQLIGLDFDKRKESGLDFSVGGEGTMTIDGETFRIFKDDPNISFEDFSDRIHNNLVLRIRDKAMNQDQVMKVYTSGHIDQLAIFTPKGIKSKEIEISL